MSNIFNSEFSHTRKIMNMNKNDKAVTKTMSGTAVKPVKKISKTKEVKEKIDDSIIIVDKKKRSVLGEGRNNGMAFGFLKKIDDNTYETVQPPSPCKDYLAEIVFTEKYDIKTSAYGLKYPKKLNIFSDVGYMVIELMKTMQDSYNYSKSFDEDNITLVTNYPIMQKIINNFEEVINLNKRTIIERVGVTNQYLVTIPIEWCQSTASISLYSLLLRVLMVADKEQDLVEFLEKYTYNAGDKSFVSSIIHKIKLIIKEKKLPPNRIPYSRSQLLNGYTNPHNNGIMSWDSKFEEVMLVD